MRVGVDVMTLRNPWEGETVDTFAQGISEQVSSPPIPPHPAPRIVLLAD